MEHEFAKSVSAGKEDQEASSSALSTDFPVSHHSNDSWSGGTQTGENQVEKKTSKNKTTTLKSGKHRKKKAKLFRRPRLDYTVQEGEDMLFIISNAHKYDSVWKPKRKTLKKKNKSKGKATVQPSVKKQKTSKTGITKKALDREPGLKPVRRYTEDDTGRWSRNLPVELLVNIFQMVVNQDGAVPFLCRAARVCQLWNSAAANPVLWRSVSVGYCWTEPGKPQLPKMESKVKNTICWLAENRFSQLREFSLCHWKKHVDYVVQVVSESCPRLVSLRLSYCSHVTDKAFENLGKSCPLLESIDLQYSEVQVEGLVVFLEGCGRQIKKILFTYGSKSDRLLSVIANGCCPELRILEINTKLDSGFCQLPVCIQALQTGCPKLQVFRMLNVTPMVKTVRKDPGSFPGFPHLEELCLATSSMSFMTDQHLNSILHSSSNLKVLDLRGCARITTAVLSTLPCEGLECLYWGLHFSSSSSNMVPKKGVHLLTHKWSRTLRELDLACQPFSEDDLEVAMYNLAHGTGAELLRSLNLSSTKVRTSALRAIISQCLRLSYLNLSSCRYLPRGLKKVYRCQEDIRQLLNSLCE